VFLCSCAFGTKQRGPASFSDSIFKDSIIEISNNIDLFATDPSLCTTILKERYDVLFNLPFNESLFDGLDQAQLDRDINESFLTRIKLKDVLKTFSLSNPLEKDCYTEVVKTFKALRYVEDYMIEERMNKNEKLEVDYVDMSGEAPYLLVNPLYKSEIKSYLDLKSGDVILSRGNAYSSAAIARIGENDFQFSHLSFVYQNPKEDNALYTTEAHIEIGSVVAKMEEHIESKNARSVVFRYKDQSQSNKASEYMFNRVKEASSKGKNIEYDFSMNYKDSSKLFCSEIISAGFHEVLEDKSYVPKFKSKFNVGLIPFLNDIGVPVTKENISSFDVFSPGDIQFDPNFDLVLEWRNPKKMQESRFKDFILTKIFEKMEKEDFRFDSNLKLDIQTKSYWLMRRIPLVKKFLDKKFPLNMTPTQMEVFIILDKIGETVMRELEKENISASIPLSPKDIYSIIDRVISSDKKIANLFKK
jgi:hypothetical protein